MLEFERGLALIATKKEDFNARRVAHASKKETAKIVALTMNNLDQNE